MARAVNDENKINTQFDIPSANVLGVRVHALTVPILHNAMAQVIDAQGHALVLNANVRALNLAYDLAWFRHLLNRAELVYCDGSGVRLAALLGGGRLPARITLADWAWELGEFAASCNYSFYFLGGRPGVAEKAAVRLQERFHTLHIAGTHHGYFNKGVDHPENLTVVEHINRVRPDILILGFGMPLQERWLLENWNRLDARTALAGGAVFDFISGDLKRAPEWMNDHSMEWLGRFLIEPRRLWRRYLLGNPLFFWRVLRYRMTGKLPTG